MTSTPAPPGPTASAMALVIFGATGDLALRMLFPALYFLHADGLLPDDLLVMGTSRSELTDEAFAGRIEAAVRERAGGDFREQAWAGFARRLQYCGGDAGTEGL